MNWFPRWSLSRWASLSSTGRISNFIICGTLTSIASVTPFDSSISDTIRLCFNFLRWWGVLRISRKFINVKISFPIRNINHMRIYVIKMIGTWQQLTDWFSWFVAYTSAIIASIMVICSWIIDTELLLRLLSHSGAHYPRNS